MATRTVAKRANKALSSVLLSNAPSFSVVVPHFSRSSSSASFSSGSCSSLGLSNQNQQLLSSSVKRWFSEKAEATKEEEYEEKADETVKETSAEDEAESKKDAPAEEEPEVSKEEKLEAEVKELKNQLLRSLAEQENTRRIAQRDVDSARQFAIKSFAKSLLEVSDNLTLALSSVPEDVRHDKEGSPALATLYEGIEMTDKGLNKAFEKNGLVKYGKEGETFDPELHEALYEYEDPNKEPGSVGQLVKSGFLLNKRVLRPAEVGVVKKTN